MDELASLYADACAGVASSAEDGDTREALATLRTLSAALAPTTAALARFSSQASTAAAALVSVAGPARAAVERARELAARKAQMQMVYDTVEDFIDLQAIMEELGDGSAASRDADTVARSVRRFRALQGTLPVPESDVELVTRVEQQLMDDLTRRFDAAIEQNQRLRVAAAASSMPDVDGSVDVGDAVSDVGGDAAAASAALSQEISRCCRLMAVLGHADLGLERYTAFLVQTTERDFLAELSALASRDGLEAPLSAVNALSACFARATTVMDAATDTIHTLFDAMGSAGVAAGVQCVASVTDTIAARLMCSFARSGRVTAALRARERLMMAAAAGSSAGSAASPSTTGRSATSGSVLISDSVRTLWRANVEDSSNSAPLATPSPQLVGVVWQGVDYTDMTHFEALCDELVLCMQRATSFTRIVQARLAAIAAPPSAAVLSPVAASAAAAFAQSNRMRDAMSECGAAYASCQQASTLSGLNKALAMDEVLPEGAAGASVDVISLAALQALDGSLHDQAMTIAAGVRQAGAGALVTTFIEDAVYVASRGCKRALASGHADTVATVLNHACVVLQERLVNEAAVRCKACIQGEAALSAPVASSAVGATVGGASASAGASRGDDADGGSMMDLFPLSLSQAQVAGLASLRRSILNSAPMKLAAVGLAELQSIPVSGRTSAGGSGVAPLSTSASGTAAAAAAAAGSSSDALARPSARLSEEVAAAATAMNNVHVGINAVTSLALEMESELPHFFTDAREVSKIEASVKGLRDCSSALRKHLEDAVSALISKLTPRLRSALNIFEGASSLIQYDLTEAAFSAYMDGSSNAFVQEFLPVLAAIIAPYQFTLTPPLGYVVVRRIASYVAKHLEPRIRRKRVNALGSLALDADMRALVTLFVDRTSWHVRSKFTRLLQVTSVLGVSQPAEVADIRAALSAPGAWLLNTEEVRAVLSQRTDFRAIDIDRACAALPPL